MIRFHQRVCDRVRSVGNHLCVGIDPHRQKMPPFLDAALQRLGPEDFLLKLCRALFEGAAGAAALKFQSAFFESFGTPGFRALEIAIQEASQHGFLTILDAKRGDISSTMHAYGETAFDRMGADALTVTAYMGTEVLDALRPWGAKGKGAYVVWISSNPSGRQVQDAVISATGETVADMLQRAIDSWEIDSAMEGMTGYVLGATKLDGNRVAKLMQRERFFLMPGVGAQGGKIDEVLCSVLKKHPGTLVAMSRSLTGLGAGDAASWGTIKSWDEYSAKVFDACAAARADLIRSPGGQVPLG